MVTVTRESISEAKKDFKQQVTPFPSHPAPLGSIWPSPRSQHSGSKALPGSRWEEHLLHWKQ
ncbi:hypothetical protein PO909_033085 [Leuciscus waleckii]